MATSSTDEKLDPLFEEPPKPPTLQTVLWSNAWRGHLAFFAVIIALYVGSLLGSLFFLAIIAGWATSGQQRFGSYSEAAGLLVGLTVFGWLLLADSRSPADEDRVNRIGFGGMAGLVIGMWLLFLEFGVEMFNLRSTPAAFLLETNLWTSLVLITVSWISTMLWVVSHLGKSIERLYAHDYLLRGRRGVTAQYVRISAASFFIAFACVPIFRHLTAGYSGGLIKIGMTFSTALLCAVFGGYHLGRLLEHLREPVHGPQPEFVDWFPNSWTEGCNFRFAHLSDLHITASDSARRVEGGASGNRNLSAILHRSVDSLAACDCILITGDITDSGDRGEWKRFFDGTLIPAKLLSRTILVPGNHDLNITSATNLRVTEGPSAILRRLRLCRMLAVLNEIQGNRASVLSAGGALVNLCDHIASYSKTIRRYVQSPVIRTFRPEGSWLRQRRIETTTDEQQEEIRRLDKAWDLAFPMAIPFVERKVVIIVVDSNDAASSIIGNAYGRISASSLDRLSKLLEHFNGWRCIVAMHHHLTIPPLPDGLITETQRRLMSLVNAPDLQDVLLSIQPMVVTHGHLHVSYWRRLQGRPLFVCSAASTSLGDESRKLPPSFDVYTLDTAGMPYLMRSAIRVAAPGRADAV